MRSRGIPNGVVRRIARRVWCVTAAILVAASGVASAQTQFDDISIGVSAADGEVSHGYAEYRFILTNHSPSKEHVVQITMPCQSHVAGHTIGALSRTVRLDAGAHATVMLYQPALPLAGDGAEVQIDGKAFVLTVPRVSSVWGSWASNLTVSVFTSRGVHADFDTEMQMVASGMPAAAIAGGPSWHGSGTIASAVQRAEGTIDEWSTHWLAYTRYNAVVLTAEEYERAPAAVREAILAYARTGGMLLIFGETRLPEAVGRPISAAMLKEYPYMFGRIVVSPEPSIATWGKEAQWKQFCDLCVLGEKSWQDIASPFNRIERSAEFRQNALPLRGMFALMVLFGVVIGPVNLIVLGRMRRRIWMLWTTPVIAFITCASILTYNVFAEGWNSRVRVAGITVLDEANHRATTQGWARYYCPLTPSDGLHLNTQTMVTAVMERTAPWEFRSSGSSRSIDWTHDQHLKHGWIAARTPTYLMFDVDEVRRERLIVEAISETTLRISNGLGASIVSLTVADENGRLFVAGKIDAGAEATATATGQTIGAAAGTMGDNGTADSRAERIPRVAREPQNYLRANMYVAVLDSAPFVSSGLTQKGMDLTGRSVVIGLMKGREQ